MRVAASDRWRRSVCCSRRVEEPSWALLIAAAATPERAPAVKRRAAALARVRPTAERVALWAGPPAKPCHPKPACAQVASRYRAKAVGYRRRPIERVVLPWQSSTRHPRVGMKAACAVPSAKIPCNEHAARGRGTPAQRPNFAPTNPRNYAAELTPNRSARRARRNASSSMRRFAAAIRGPTRIPVSPTQPAPASTRPESASNRGSDQELLGQRRIDG